MKKRIYLFIIFCSFLSFNCSEKKLDLECKKCIENKHLEKVEKENFQENTKLIEQNIHAEFEKFLINNKILKGETKENYIELIKKLSRSPGENKEIIEKFRKSFEIEPLIMTYFTPVGNHHCYFYSLKKLSIVEEDIWQAQLLNEIDVVFTQGNNKYPWSDFYLKTIELIPESDFKKKYYRKFYIIGIFNLMINK